MTADPELLLTVQGVDVTPYVWDWGTLRLTDAWNQHPTLSVELRCDFTQAASLSVPAFADVRLVNLLTGVVLFEGVQASDLSQRTGDPHWIYTDVSATGYGTLLDTAPLQSDYTAAAGSAIDATTWPLATDLIRGLLLCAFADYRVATAPVYYPDFAPHPYLLWGWADSAPSKTWTAGSSVWSAIGDVLSMSRPWDGSVTTDIMSVIGKLVPNLGMVLARPSTAFRGSAPVSLTAAGAGRPAAISALRSDGSVASGIVETGGSPSARVYVDNANLTSRTNGYLVARGSTDVSALWAASPSWPSVDRVVQFLFDSYDTPLGLSTGFTLTTARIPADILVGHSVTFDHPYWGTVSGAVQSVSTQFVGGQLDKAATGLPYMLNSGRNLDGTWNLDATAVSGTERHPRVHTVTVAALNRTFMGSARAYGLGIHG